MTSFYKICLNVEQNILKHKRGIESRIVIKEAFRTKFYYQKIVYSIEKSFELFWSLSNPTEGILREF